MCTFCSHRVHTICLDTFLQINDQINTVLNRYDAFKRGDYAAAANPVPSELSRPQGDLSLIDLDESQPSTGPANITHSEIDELASLFGPSASSAPAQISLNNTQPTFSQLAQAQRSTPTAMMSGMPFAMSSSSNGSSHQPPVNIANRPGGGMASPIPFHTTSSPGGTPPPGSIRLPGTPQGQTLTHAQQLQHSAAGAGFPTASGIFATHNAPPAYNTSNILGAASVPQPMQPQTAPQPSSTNSAAQSQGKDPFADLVGLF